MNKTHTLKLSHEFYPAVLSGEKSFEIRNNDRGFQKDDRVIFKEVDHLGCITMKESNPFIINYVLSGWGLREGYVAFSISPL